MSDNPTTNFEVCPNCGEPLVPGVTWCAKCGAGKVQVPRFDDPPGRSGKYPISTVWILMLLVFVPLASCGGCVVFGSMGAKPTGEYEFFSQGIMTGAMVVEALSFFLGILLLGYNGMKGKQ